MARAAQSISLGRVVDPSQHVDSTLPFDVGGALDIAAPEPCVDCLAAIFRRTRPVLRFPLCAGAAARPASRMMSFVNQIPANPASASDSCPFCHPVSSAGAYPGFLPEDWAWPRVWLLSVGYEEGNFQVYIDCATLPTSPPVLDCAFKLVQLRSESKFETSIACKCCDTFAVGLALTDIQMVKEINHSGRKQLDSALLTRYCRGVNEGQTRNSVKRR